MARSVETPPNGSAIRFTIPNPSARIATTKTTMITTPRIRSEQAGALRRRDQPHQLQTAELPRARRLDAEALGRALEVVGTAFGERERCIGHPAQLQPLLRASRGKGALEMRSCGLGVIPFRRPRTEDRLGGRLELRLRLELLVGATLHLLHRGELTALLDPHDPLLLRHGDGV